MKIKLSKSQWENIGKTAGWIQDEVSDKSRMANDIANLLMQNHGVTNFELTQKYPNLSLIQAQTITGLVASAFGPGGNGLQWLSGEILKILTS